MKKYVLFSLLISLSIHSTLIEDTDPLTDEQRQGYIELLGHFRNLKDKALYLLDVAENGIMCMEKLLGGSNDEASSIK